MSDVRTKLMFYGTVSVDGYIARNNHSLDWLLGTEGEEEIGYEESCNFFGNDEFPFRGGWNIMLRYL